MRFTCRPVDTSFFDTASMRFKNAVELDAPPAMVFAIFDDEQSWSKWFRAIHKVVWTRAIHLSRGDRTAPRGRHGRSDLADVLRINVQERAAAIA